MKSYITRIVSSMLVMVMLFLTMAPVLAYAQETDEPSTVTAPKGYVPKNIYLNTQTFRLSRTRSADQNTPKVLLIEDVNPWDSVANQTVLSGITQYDKVTTSEFLNVNLEEYGVVVFANDQPFSTYDNYSDFKEYLEVFASIGGVIVFGACDAGWSNGELIEKLPGNVTKKTHYEENNYVANSNHAIIGGSLTEGTVLQSSDLVSMYCSHVSFDEASLPAGSTVILRESSTNRPTLVEYPLGKGRVIASGLTWEHNYVHGGSTISGVKTGRFAKIAMADMFQYAIRVSSIDVDELYLLEQWKLERNKHAVIVVEAGLNLENLKPIAGATVSIGGKNYTTDSNGTVLVADYGAKTVTVTADNYIKNVQDYTLEPSTSRIIFMDRKPVEDRPVLVRASVAYPITEKYKDVRSQIVNIPSGDDYNANFIFKADWKGHGEGTYRLYQGSDYYRPDHHVDIPKGNGTFPAGNYFAQGKQMKLILIAADGTTSDPINLNININEPKVEAVKEQNSIEWMGRNKAITAGDFFFTLVSNLVLDVVGEALPIDMKMKDNEDGSTTYRFLIGVTKGEAKKIWEHTGNGWSEKKDEDEKDDEKFFHNAWDSLKDKIEGAKEAGGLKNAMKDLKANIMSKWDDAKPDKVSVEAARSLEVDFMGYLENTLLGAKITTGSAGVMASGSASGQIGSNFMAGPVPMYIEFTIDAGVEAILGGGLELKNGTWSPKLDFEGIELQLLGLKLGVGAGVRSVATIGGWGKGDFKLTFLDPAAAAKVKGDITFAGGLEAKVMWVINWNQPIAKKTWQLFPAKNAKMYARMIDDPHVSLASRSYLSQESAWMGNVLPRAFKSEGVTLQTLQSGVMPDAIPKLHLVDDQLIMLYMADDSDRTLGNHTRLMYSVYDNGIWTEPIPVWESNTADYFFDSVVIDDKLHVVWQKAKREMNITNVDDAVSQLAENAEICYAVWTDKKGFTSQQYLTDNSTFDMLPAVAADGRNVYAVWANNSENDIYGIEGVNTINALHIRNGKPDDVHQLHVSEEQLLEMAAGVREGRLNVLYTAMDDNSEMGMWHVGNNITKVEMTGVPSALSYRNNEFQWQADGALYSYDPLHYVASTLTGNGESSISANYQHLTNDSNEMIIWFDETIEGLSKICASVPNGSGWSLPIVLAEFASDSISYSDAILLDNGDISIVLNTAERDTEGDLTNSALKYAVITPATDVGLESVTLSYPDWTANKQNVNLLLKNNGITPVSSVHVTMQKGSNVYLNQTIALNLQPGEEAFVETSMDLSNVLAVTDTLVTVQAEGDINPSNDVQEVTIGHVDAQIALDVYERNNNVMFVFSVANNSNTVANAALSIIEDREDGIVIDVKNIGTVTSDHYVQYLYSLNKENIDFDENGHKTYFFKIDTLETDYSESDNMIHYTVRRSGDDHDLLYITQQPADQFAVVGQQATFTISATGENVTYQWYINRNDGTGWKKIDGAIGSSYTTSITDLECDGFKYYCKVSDQYGNTLNSDEAVLHVATAPVLPETGDSSTPVLWLAMSTLSMLGILLMRKKAYSK